MPWSAPRRPSCSPRARRHSCRSRTSTLSRGSPTMSSSCSSRCLIRSACSAGLVLLLAAAAPWRRAVAQQQDEALVGELARLLAAADARAFDAPLFREALHAPDAVVRRQAALGLGRIGDLAGTDLLVESLSDSDQTVRAAAAFGLGLLKDARAVEPLLVLVRAVPAGEQGPPQAEAVTAIAKIGGDPGADALRGILGTGSTAGVPTSLAQSTALLEAWRLGMRAPVPSLLGFADDPDLNARWHALYALARLRGARGVPALLRALDDSSALVRAVAVRGVSRALVDSARLDPQTVVGRLRPLFADRDPQVRINALRALATFRDTALSRLAAPLAGDGDVNVAVQAETTLGVLGGSAAVEALTGRLATAVFALRRQALIALAQTDSAAGATAAAALTGDADWRWRSVAAEAFGAAHDRPRLEAQLADRDGRVVAQALQALARIVLEGDTTLGPRARELLAHADPAVRSVAADVLARHPATADVDRLVQAYNRAAAEPWGAAAPITTGRGAEAYRDAVRRYLLAALRGQPPRVTIETDRGTMAVELYATEAPLTVAAFLSLVDRRYFDGSRWHRVVPNFVAQDGDPRGDGWGGPGFVLRDEVNPIRYDAGTMGMALSGPDTGGSQFFITHSAQPHLDGVYTVFGRVVSGLNVLGAIAQGDRIRSMHR